MSGSHTFAVQLTLLDGYRFEVDFGEFGRLLTDEPAPLGEGSGPNPARLLAAGVANCLAASLLFALRKFKDEPGQVSATVQGELERQDGRWRIGALSVTLQLDAKTAQQPHLQQALSQFEDFCIVTQSVRQGIAVEVHVVGPQGENVQQTTTD